MSRDEEEPRWVRPRQQSGRQSPSIARKVAIMLLRSPEFDLETVAHACETNVEFVRKIAATYGAAGAGRYALPWGETMKAITVMQPYAHLIAHGTKRVENRSWPIWKQWSGMVPSVEKPGVLLIHAGQGMTWWTDSYGLRKSDCDFGAAVALSRVVACVEKKQLEQWVAARGPRMEWLRTHEHAHGPWCWILEETVPLLRPVPLRGSQGIWECSSHLIEPHAPICPDHGIPFCGCQKVRDMLVASGAVKAEDPPLQ